MMQPRVFDSVPLPVDQGESFGARRADIVISGLEHAGPSFELRVFVNNPSANVDTPATPEDGYAGSVYVYGHGGRTGSGGDDTSGLPRLPVTRYVVATDALRAATASGKSASVALVPVAFSGPEADVDLRDATVSVLVRE